MGYINKAFHEGKWEEATAQDHVLPLIAFTAHANTQGLRKVISLSL